MSTPSLPLVRELSSPPDRIEACTRFFDLPYLLLLDSVNNVHDQGRYSFLTADPAIVLRTKGPITSVRRHGSRVWRAAAGDLLETAARELAPFWHERTGDLPPFQGGAAGYIGYEFGGRLEDVPEAPLDDLALPDAVLGIYDWVVAWDHTRGRAWIFSTGIPGTNADRAGRAQTRLTMVERRLERPVASPDRPPPPEPLLSARAPTYPVHDVSDGTALGLRSTFSPAGYRDAVRRVRDYIVRGDIFQANLAQRFEVIRSQSPFDVYRRLRERNPAPFSAYFVTDETAVLCSSPERFLRLDPVGHVTTCPIKGTRSRGDTPADDDRLAQELMASEKDRAENVMIVDLLRNDLSRVCRPGTVAATALLELERHPTVHHLVSTVEGDLDRGAGPLDLLRAAFPGGSITGAPKIRAMEIIAELEPTTRGVYSGTIGYLSLTGEMDTNIAIRTGVCGRDRFYFPAGGGIVADSDPESEYWETLHKAEGLVAAFRDHHGGT